MDGSSHTVSLTVELPSDWYARIEALARSLNVPVSQAAALTIRAGQAAQDAADTARADRLSRMDELATRLKEMGGKANANG
jgi:hypothetical protein